MALGGKGYAIRRNVKLNATIYFAKRSLASSACELPVCQKFSALFQLSSIDVKRAPMILFVVIFDLAADECRPTVFVNQRCVLHEKTFELKSSDLRFGVPVTISFPDEFIIFCTLKIEKPALLSPRVSDRGRHFPN